MIKNTNNIELKIDLNAKKADSIYFPNAFRAVKNLGVLPPELIDYLTEEGTFEGVLSKAGFGTKEFSKDEYHSSFGRVLKCSSYQEVLDEYTRKFMFAISPFVKTYSYIEFLHPYTGNYPQGEGYKYRWEFDGFQPDVRIYY